MLAATKLGRMTIYLDGLLSIKSCDPLIKWSCETTWQNIITISPLSKCLWLPDLARWWPSLMCSRLWTHITLRPRDLVRSRDNLKSLYHHYHSVYGHQTWPDGNEPLMGSCLKNHMTLSSRDIIWPSDHVRSCDKLKSLYLHYQSAYAHQTLHEGNLPSRASKSNDFLITWSCQITWQSQIIISTLPQCL